MIKNNYDLESPLLDLFQSIAIKIKKEADQSIKNLGLNSQQGKMIKYIFEHEKDGIIQKDLCEEFNRTGASITSMLQGLEKKGYIERRIPKENERQKNIYVLPKGEKLINDFDKAFSEAENSIKASLSKEEILILEKLLNKINHSL